MLRWLPSQEGLDTIGLEATYARDTARMARLCPVRQGRMARLTDTVRAHFRDRHALTEHPCRMPDGRIGRTAIREVEGDWIAVCVLTRGKPGASYRSNGDRLRALRRFVDFYERGRPHTAIGGLVPQAAVNNVLGHHG